MKFHPPIANQFFSQLVVFALLAGLSTLKSVSQVAGHDTRTVTLKQGQILQMKLVKRVRSRRAHIGDDVLLQLVEPVSAEGQTVLPKGLAIHGKITTVKRAGKNCQYGSVDWELQPIRISNSETIELRFLDESTPGWKLLNPATRASAQPVAPLETSNAPNQKKGSLIVGIVKGIIVVPLVVIAYPLAAIAEGQSACPRGRGIEISFGQGQLFYAQVGADARLRFQGSGLAREINAESWTPSSTKAP